MRDIDDRMPNVRASAARDLVAHAPLSRSSVIGALERALRDPAAQVRSAAALALADTVGVEVLGSLLAAVEDEDPDVREMALAAIGEIRDPRARERLRRALGDERPEVRFQAVIAFARVAPDEAKEAFVGALSDPDRSIRHIAIRVAEECCEGRGISAAAELVPAMAPLLDDGDPSVRVAAAIFLARAGDARGGAILVDVVAGRQKTKEADDEAICVEIVGEMGLEDATRHLERRAFGLLARLGAEPCAWQAVVALARMGHAGARSRILRELGSRSRDRRTLAVAAAGRAGLLEVRPFIEAMQGDETRAEQEAVAEALGALLRRDSLQFPADQRDLVR